MKNIYVKCQQWYRGLVWQKAVVAKELAFILLENVFNKTRAKWMIVTQSEKNIFTLSSSGTWDVM